METKALWTPDGVRVIGAKQPARVEMRAGAVEWLRQFSDFAAALNLGLHCGRCGADVIGKNADSDKVFSATCGCREFIGPNRDYRAPH